MSLKIYNEKDLAEKRIEGATIQSDEDTLQRTVDLEQVKTEVELANATITEILMLLPMLGGGGEL